MWPNIRVVFIYTNIGPILHHCSNTGTTQVSHHARTRVRVGFRVGLELRNSITLMSCQVYPVNAPKTLTVRNENEPTVDIALYGKFLHKHCICRADDAICIEGLRTYSHCE